jgi:hypothetical protein
LARNYWWSFLFINILKCFENIKKKYSEFKEHYLYRIDPLFIKEMSGPALPLSSNYVHEHNYENDNLTLQDHLLQCLDGSCNLTLIRSFRESEEKYVVEQDYGCR